MAREFPWTGVGRGAFEGPAAAFRQHSEGVRLVFPENLAGADAVRVGHSADPRCWPSCSPCRPCRSSGGSPLGADVPGRGRRGAGGAGPRAGGLRPGAAGGGVSHGHGCWVCAPGGCRCRPATRRKPTNALTTLAVSGHDPGDMGVDPGRRRLGGAPGHPSRRAGSRSGCPGSRPPRPRLPCGRWSCATRRSTTSSCCRPVRRWRRAIRRRYDTSTGPCDCYPRSAAPHLMAFHYLASIGRRSQAAVEYRLAVERGLPFVYQEVVSTGRDRQRSPGSPPASRRPAQSGPGLRDRRAAPAGRDGQRSGRRRWPKGPRRRESGDWRLPSPRGSVHSSTSPDRSWPGSPPVPGASSWPPKPWHPGGTCRSCQCSAAGPGRTPKRLRPGCAWRSDPLPPRGRGRRPRCCSNASARPRRCPTGSPSEQLMADIADKPRMQRPRRQLERAFDCFSACKTGATRTCPEVSPVLTRGRCACGGCGCPATRSGDPASPPGRNRSCRSR